MLKENHRIKLIVSFAVTAIFVIAIIGASWNSFKDELSFWPLLNTVIALAALSNLFRISYKLSDTEKLEEYVAGEVAKGKAALLAEIKENEEAEKQNDTEEEVTDEKIKELIPAGNFKNIDAFAKKLMLNIANRFNLVQGIFYTSTKNDEDFDFLVGFALPDGAKPKGFKLGESFNGEAARDKELMKIEEIPAEYFTVESGLGENKPICLYLLPIVQNDKAIALIEFASFNELSENCLEMLKVIATESAAKITKIEKA